MSACYSHRYSPYIHSINHYIYSLYSPFVLRCLFTSFLFVYFFCLYVYSHHTTVHTVTTICQASHFVYIFSFYLNTSLNSGFCLTLRATCNFATVRNAFVAQTETVSCFVSVAWQQRQRQQQRRFASSASFTGLSFSSALCRLCRRHLHTGTRTHVARHSQPLTKTSFLVPLTAGNAVRLWTLC